MDEYNNQMGNMINSMAQTTFNNIAYAYKHDVIPRELAMECLSFMFGESKAKRYMERLDQYEKTPPPLTPDFNVEDVFQQCRDFKEKWDQFKDIIDMDQIIQQ
ncbi:hypothetical protein CYY_000819 [Polysphondylium violaceum]|uniref:Uncharacterized protein n=1 Tax=Polysphondylium violaceum TaxID=133409 RepID=A0A8J4Q322_9MYCE|nr:hypothetical protein CYY_000819 [Polysphondylium violaceum]